MAGNISGKVPAVNYPGSETTGEACKAGLSITSKAPLCQRTTVMSLATHNDHGGKFIHVVTKEMGYSKNQNATMDGTRLKEKRYQWITEGNEIVGCERTWDASGFEMGQFVYTATSQNHPWNDYTAQIYVK